MFSFSSKLCLCGALLVGGQQLLPAELFPIGQTPPTNLPTSLSITLAWNPSTESNVIGYILCWGTARGGCTNQLDVGNVTSATLGGLTPQTNYIAVIAYSRDEQSPPSNEVELFLGESPPMETQPILKPELLNAGTNAVLNLSFPGASGATYHIQASTNLEHWETIATTNCAATEVISCAISSLTNYPVRFFRLRRE